MTIKNINAEELALDVKDNAVVLLDLWAPWCGYCRMLDPVLDEVAGDLAEAGSEVALRRVNIDEEPELADAYGVDTIPTLMLFVNGEPVARTSGFMPKDAIMDFITEGQA
ncbi:MAG: thioredoxin [Firmicutes bacterium]|nr:thioredoxin [Bacillota bacterium]